MSAIRRSSSTIRTCFILFLSVRSRIFYRRSATFRRKKPRALDHYFVKCEPPVPDPARRPRLVFAEDRPDALLRRSPARIARPQPKKYLSRGLEITWQRRGMLHGDVDVAKRAFQ